MEDCLFEKKIEKPSIPLYKYFGNLDYAKDAIINKRIHFESPLDYNDIYDCRFYLSDNDLLNCFSKGETIIRVFEAYFSTKPYIEDLRNNIFPKFENESELRIFKVISTIINHVPDNDIKDFLKAFRNQLSINNMTTSGMQKVSCFSENKDALLMWSYYANSHKGVCLEFDLRKDNTLYKHCHKVHYTRHFKNNDSNYTFFCKSEEWSHEQEWRIVQIESEYIPTSSLVGVYVGANASDEARTEFLDLCKEHKLDLYFCEPSIKEYKLNFVQILYKGEVIDLEDK